MKRLFAGILTLTLVLCSACGQTAESSSAPEAESGSVSDGASVSASAPVSAPAADAPAQSEPRQPVLVAELPQMDARQQELYDKYVEYLIWPVNDPLTTDFDDRDGCDRAFNPYFLFTHAYYLENGIWGGSSDVPNYPDFPAELVESVIGKYFLWSAEDIRAVAGADWTGEYYDPASDTYHFPGGYGGVPPEYFVTGWRQDGGTLEIDCEAYWSGGMSESGGNELIYKNTLTVLTEADGYKIAANRVTYR